MSIRTDVFKHLKTFGVVNCHVRSAELISFSCQKWVIDDALEPRQTMLFFYNTYRPRDDQWAAREWDFMTGIHGCACYKPKERWVFDSDPGEVYVLGQGDDDEEAPIRKTSKIYIQSLKCIAGGYAYAVGPARSVYKRQGKNK
jgi:hypothetical protein